MVSRVEFALIAAILFFATRGVVTEISYGDDTDPDRTKQLELVSATFYEIDSSDIVSTMRISKLIKYSDETKMLDFELISNDLELRADIATERDGLITLEQNGTMVKPDGSRYLLSNAVYDKTRRTLRVLGKFSLQNRFGDINGTKMRYDLQGSELDGEGIKAVYEIE